MDEREAQVILTAQTEQYNRKIEESQKATDKFVKSLEKVSETSSKIVKNTSKGLLKIGAAEIASLTALSAVAATLEKQTSNIQANLALNKSSSQFNAVTSAIREMSRTMPMARAEIAAMATSVSDLGFVSAEQVGQVSKQFSKMGIATGESAQGLAANMVQFQRAMGVTPSAQTMNPYSESTTLLSAQAGVPANDILSFASSIAPASRVAGLNQSTVLGLSTAATRAGVDGMYASSTISQILNDITMLRYTKSPEMRRYSSALGIPLQDLTADVTDTDAFNRNIISKIIEASQTEEGPTRMGLLGFDGLRAKRALQGLAAEPGGVEQWIRRAEYGMGTESVQTGFEAASSGLTDEMTMLRNRMTDLGQVVGAPTMEAFTGLAKGANALASFFQPLTDILTKITGVLGGAVGTATMLAGAMYGAWKTFSTMSLIRRGVQNTTTSSLLSGFLQGQRIGANDPNINPNTPVNPMAARVMGGNGSAWQQAMFTMGSGVGTMAPGLHMPQSPLQRMLMRVDQLSRAVSGGAVDWYAKAKLNPDQRYEMRQRQNMIDAAITPPHSGIAMNKAELQERAANWEKFQKNYKETQAMMKGRGYNIPDLPPMSVYDPADKQSVTGVMRGVAKGYVQVPAAAAGYAGTEARRFMPALRQGITNVADDFKTGAAGTIGGGIRGIGSTLFNPATMALAATAYGVNYATSASNYTDRWKEGGKGLDGEIANTMTKYNEKLGIATQSLQRFAAAVDEANPAKTDDIEKELRDEQGTYYRGAAGDYTMVDERVKTFAKDTESVKQWLASKGTLNADQLKDIFTDLGAVMNKSEWTQVRDWYLANSKNGTPTATAINNTGFAGTAASFNESASSNRNMVQKILSFIPNMGSLDMMRLGDRMGQGATDYISVAQASGQFFGNTREASDVVKGDLSNTDKSQVLSTVAQFGKVAEALDELNKVYLSKGDWDISGLSTSRAAFYTAKDRAGELLGNIDLSGINPGPDASEDIWKRMYAEIVKQSENDKILRSALENGLITEDKKFGGTDLNTFLNSLGVKEVTTSIDTMIDTSRFSGMSKGEREKWFGHGTVLSEMGTGITDPMKALGASMQMLRLAQDKFGQSIASTDGALQSFKSNLTQSDPNWNIVSGAQQLNDFLYGQFYEAGGSSTDRATSFAQRAQSAREDYSAKTPSPEAADNLLGVLQEGQSTIIQWYQKAREFEKSRERQTYDFNKQMEYMQEDYNTQVEYAEDDHQKQMTRSKDAYHRQLVHSEAAFHRSLKYQKQDFYRSREREEQAHARQMQYMAEDMAKAIGDPYNRIQLQLLNDPNAMISNMENKLNLVSKQNQNIDTLRGRGLSEEAVQQLNLTDFNNAQQTQHLANTMTDADIAEFNRIAKSMVKQGGQLNEETSGVKRSEKEREIGLAQSLDDFIRNLKRTKVEHAIQVKFSQKEFNISISNAEEDFEISMQRMEDAFQLSRERSNDGFERQMQRQADDLVEYYESYALTQEEMVNQTEKILRTVTSKGTRGVIKQIQVANIEILATIKLIEKMAELASEIKIPVPHGVPKDDGSRNAPSSKSGDRWSGGYYGGYGGGTKTSARTSGGRTGTAVRNAISDSTNEPGMCLSQVSRWYGDAPGGVPSAIAAWSRSKYKHPGDTKPPAGVPVYWGGGMYGHVALSLGAGLVRSTDWPRSGRVGTVSIKELSSAWNKPYLGWAGDTWGKALADGGIAIARPGGVKATIAEAGSNEAVIPLDKRGADFMMTFTKKVAQQMVMAMPKTPAANTSSVINDYSTNMTIKNVTVQTQDPKRFIRELQLEASKKRAALYKGSYSGVETT